MLLATAFRLSFYVTLALACACLALAESFFLGWIGYFLAGTLALMALAYRWEGRRALSEDAANRLGMVIAIGAAFWILYQLPRSEEELMASGVPWPAGLLPHLGPVLIILLLVKLFRPIRFADFWVIQTIGLMMATLSCVLAAEPMFGLLLVFYLAALLWSLALFYQVREHTLAQRVAPRCAEDQSLFPVAGALGTPLVPWRYFGLGAVTRWTVAVVVIGLVLFLLAPRQDNFQWEPKQLSSAAKGGSRGGFEGGMDLNRMGKIELSSETAFEVNAMDVHGPKLDLEPEMRWYVQTLDYYADGRWTSWDQRAAPPGLISNISTKPIALGVLPEAAEETRGHPKKPYALLADPDYYLHFKVRLSAAGGLVLAEPLTDLLLGLNPYLGETPVVQSFFFHWLGTDTLQTNMHRSNRLHQYGQVTRKQASTDLVPAKKMDPMYAKYLLNQGIPEAIPPWVREVLATLPGLSKADCDLDANERVDGAAHAKVARALTSYLAYSGEFGYSLERIRHRMDMDPLADFLLNVKEGHCERYAGGLTLMLRSIGIPARVVKGYRGLEHLGQGHYLVRQSQAHSWVEALLPDSQWLTLDPTPTGERTVKPPLPWFGWLFQRWSESDNLWRSYIMDYNADQQARALDLFETDLVPGNAWSLLPISLGVGMVAIGGFLAYRLRRRWRLALASTGASHDVDFPLAGFYPRFLDVARRLLHLQPQPGQTPFEFALLTRSCLERRGLDERCGSSPEVLVNLLYRTRFGGHALTDSQEAEAERIVDTLEKSLQPAAAP